LCIFETATPISTTLVSELVEIPVSSTQTQIGDLSKFPAATELVFGPSTVLESHAMNPKSTLIESDFASVPFHSAFPRFY
jgi:hypothetical protein